MHLSIIHGPESLYHLIQYRDRIVQKSTIYHWMVSQNKNTKGMNLSIGWLFHWLTQIKSWMCQNDNYIFEKYTKWDSDERIGLFVKYQQFLILKSQKS